MIEVVGVSGVMHMTQISTHIRAGKRLGQFKKVEIRINSELPIQVIDSVALAFLDVICNENCRV